MAIRSRRSRKCPICVSCTDDRLKSVNGHLEPLLAEVKASGEIPKINDSRLSALALIIGFAPASLRFHLKECLLDMEIQDQRVHELRSIVDALHTAHQEYMANPSMQNATAYTSIMTSFRSLASDIEGQQDPEVTVEYVTSSVLGPINRKVLATVAEEMRSLRDSIVSLIPETQRPYLVAQFNSSMSRVGTSLRESTDDALKALCDYYRVELEAQQRKRALETTSIAVHDEGNPGHKNLH